MSIGMYEQHYSPHTSSINETCPVTHGRLQARPSVTFFLSHQPRTPTQTISLYSRTTQKQNKGSCEEELTTGQRYLNPQSCSRKTKLYNGYRIIRNNKMLKPSSVSERIPHTAFFFAELCELTHAPHNQQSTKQFVRDIIN